jgi:hypothetical protein
VFRTLRTIEGRGEELCLYYGRLACLQTLQHYGFVDAGSLAFEKVQLDLEMPDEEVELTEAHLERAAKLREGVALKEAVVAAGGGVVGEEEEEEEEEEEVDGTDARLLAVAQDVAAEQRKMRLALLARYGLELTPHFLYDEPILSPRLLATVRVLLLPPSELREEHGGEGCAGDPDAHAASEPLPTMGHEATRRVCEGVRSLVAGLAEALAPSAAAMCIPPAKRRRGADARQQQQAAAAADGGDDGSGSGGSGGGSGGARGVDGIDAGIDAYVRFQQRVVRQALCAAAALEAELGEVEDDHEEAA